MKLITTPSELKQFKQGQAIVISSNGIFFLFKNKVVEFSRKIDKWKMGYPFSQINSFKEYYKIKKKLPAKDFYEIAEFCLSTNNEVIVGAKFERSRVRWIIMPQNGSVGSVSYKREHVDIDIHSHPAGFSDFSYTDYQDDYFDIGKIAIIVFRKNSYEIGLKARICCPDPIIIKDNEELFEIDSPQTITVEDIQEEYNNIIRRVNDVNFR